MKTIAIMNVKGGVGKTMTACNMAHILAETYEKRVLLIDADPQANATTFFGLSAAEGGLTELLRGDAADYHELIQVTSYKGVYVLGCDSSLFDLDLSRSDPSADPKKAICELCDAIAKKDECDVVLIDPMYPPLYVAIVGTNSSGLSIAFARDNTSKLEPEFSAIPQDDEGTLIFIAEELAQT